jgi:hypothetical protein
LTPSFNFILPEYNGVDFFVQESQLRIFDFFIRIYIKMKKVNLNKERKRLQRERLMGISLRTKVVRDKTQYTRKKKHKNLSD